MIHIVNGDVLGERLNGIEGDVIIWREMYDYGPLHHSWTPEELISRRAAFFEERIHLPSRLFIENCWNQLEALDQIRESEEVVLWFEHDYYDQTMLMYLLDELSQRNVCHLSMVSIDSYPSFHPFYGLGQLNFEQLAELLQKRMKITPSQLYEAIQGWKVYTSTDVEELKAWMRKGEQNLPFLSEAFQTHLNSFPSIENGLNAVEYQACQIINTQPLSFQELFQKIRSLRIQYGLSDLHLAAILRELKKGKSPLLLSDGPLPKYDDPLADPKLSLTSDGFDVLHRNKNRLELIGIDWWVGGIHLYQKND